MDWLNRILGLFEINIIKTCLLNLKLFSFKEAIKIPIIVYGRYTVFDIMSLSREQIVLSCPCRTGLIRLNRRIGYNLGSKLRGSLCIHGKLIVGGKCDIGQGCNLVIRKNAEMYVADDFIIAGCSRVHVYELVKFGSHTFVSWNVHIHDTDYHYFIKDGKIFSRTKNIEIGDYVWIGHDVTVGKGASIPSNCIVASHSLVISKFNESESKGGLLLAGAPAQIKRSNVMPINDFNKDSRIDKYFHSHRDDVNNGICASFFY